MNRSTPAETNLVSRRRILGWSGVGVLAGIAGYFGWPKTPNPITGPTAMEKPVARLKTNPSAGGVSGVLAGRNAFLPLVKTEFLIAVSADMSATKCRLVEVGQEMTMEAPNARYASYSLLFSAPKSFVGEGGIYRLSHPDMEPMELFLSPVGTSEESVHLEAVFSEKA